MIRLIFSVEVPPSQLILTCLRVTETKNQTNKNPNQHKHKLSRAERKGSHRREHGMNSFQWEEEDGLLQLEDWKTMENNKRF